MTKGNIAIVRALYAGFAVADVEGVLALVDPNARWEYIGRNADNPAFGVRIGHEGVRQFFRELSQNEHILEFSPQGFYGRKDKVFVVGYADYITKTTGVRASGDWAHILTLKGGKVVALKEFADTVFVAAANQV